MHATTTDFFIVLGGLTIKEDGKDFGNWWTRSHTGLSSVYCVEPDYENGSLKDYVITKNPKDRLIGARPAISEISIDNILSKGQGVTRAEDGVLEVEYGYYPQKAASKQLQQKLENLYTNGSIEKTKNVYTTDSREQYADDERFKPRIHQEYEYDGKRYIRDEVTNIWGARLSNGEEYNNGDNVWLEVMPVKLWIDEKQKVMITEELIFSGVQFDEGKEYKGDFNETNIKRFMDKHLAKELVQIKAEKEFNANKNKNPYNLEFGEVSERDIIKGALESNVSIFLHGKPGCGKSDRVKQLDQDFIELNLSHLDPELLDGLAGEKEGRAVHIKPPWLEELEAKCEENPEEIHILFLEELTNASPMMQAKAYGIALDKKVAGRWNLPENARVVAAGNELEDSLVANEMAEPLYDRNI